MYWGKRSQSSPCALPHPSTIHEHLPFVMVTRQHLNLNPYLFYWICLIKVIVRDLFTDRDWTNDTIEFQDVIEQTIGLANFLRLLHNVWRRLQFALYTGTKV